MFTARTALTALAIAGTALGAASPALAASGRSSTKLATLTEGDRVPAAIHGSAPKAIYHAGDRVRAHEAVLRTRVRTPAHKGLAVRLTCPSGFVVGYGLEGEGGLMVNGHPTTGRHSLVVRVQSAGSEQALDGTLLALCQAVR